MAFIEIKIPKEVRDYHENIFFGLNTRQFIFSVLAVGVAVGIYFALQPYVGTEEIGWMCILSAAPFAACGFFTYHGMTAEQIFWNVTLPQLKPTTFFVIIMLTIASFKVYDQMYMITQGGPGNATMTLVYYIYNVAFVNTPKYGYASAVSMVLFVLVLFVTIIQFKGSSSND